MHMTGGWTPSVRMQKAAAAERRRIDRQLARLAGRARGLTAELDAVHAERDALLEDRETLDHFIVGDTTTPPPPAPVSDRAVVLRGAAIREHAVRVLVEQHPVGAPIHYRDWFALLTAAGYVVAGAKPIATFLTSVSRSPVVVRSTAAGEYSIDHDYIRRAHEQHARLAEQLAAIETGGLDTVEEIVARREERAELTCRIRTLERGLAEALRSLEPPLRPVPGTRLPGTDGKKGTLSV